MTEEKPKTPLAKLLGEQYEEEIREAEERGYFLATTAMSESLSSMSESLSRGSYTLSIVPDEHVQVFKRFIRSFTYTETIKTNKRRAK